MAKCANCGKEAATSRCNGCTDVRLPENMSWYCNRGCQRAHWKQHKPACKKAQLYKRVRNFVMPRDLDALWRIEAEIGIPEELIVTMNAYLHEVVPAARPEVIGEGLTNFKDDVRAAIDRVGRDFRNAEEYMANYNERVSKSVRDKVVDVDKRDWRQAHEVPFDQRPYVEGKTGADMGGMEMFAQDYATLDFESFEKLFGYHNGSNINPFLSRMMSEQLKGLDLSALKGDGRDVGNGVKSSMFWMPFPMPKK